MREDQSSPAEVDSPGEQPGRRASAISLGTALMVGGLTAAYGTLAVFAGRFLYPARGREVAWQFVADIGSFKQGASLSYVAPTGDAIAITRTGEAAAAESFIALSSICPHLGCYVHWESQNNRFFCPCHNGAFDVAGKAIAGPPAEAGQSLKQFPLKVEGGLLYIEVPTKRLASAETETVDTPTGPGHDPCLGQRPRRSRSV